MSIAELVLAGLDRRGVAPAMIDGVSGEVVTAAELAHRIRALAGGLARDGIAGRTVAVMSPNSPDYPVAMHGPMLAGATVTTVNPSYTVDEVRYQLTDSGASLVIVHPAFLETARAAAEGTGVVRIATTLAAPGHPSIADLSGPPLARQAAMDLANDTAVIPYSSGTTGLPKGVMLTHRSLVANILQTVEVKKIGAGETTLAVLPFFHIYGMQILVNLYLSQGAALVTLPRFDLEALLRLTAAHRFERLFVVPPVILALAKHPVVDQHDLSSLRYVNSAAAPLGAELAQACTARIGCPVVQGYGMTELSPVTHISDGAGFRPGAVGKLIPMTEMRLVDPVTGGDCPEGGEGEVWIRGPQVMKGYLNRPDATAAMVDGEGWLRTGDIGAVDADGFLFIRDRLKELIKVKGFQVAPAEIEALLLTHPGIADCAVVGRADEEAGEVPVAHVVAVKGRLLEEGEVKAHVARALATYKHLAEVRFVEAIPKSPSGKILRRLLRDAARV
ncbi:MAG: AMP-binding protein [Paracoccaceae bacterium]